MSDCDRNYFELCNDVLGELYFDEVDTFDELEDIEEGRRAKRELNKALNFICNQENGAWTFREQHSIIVPVKGVSHYDKPCGFIEYVKYPKSNLVLGYYDEHKYYASSATGTPTGYWMSDGKIRLYPTPDRTYNDDVIEVHFWTYNYAKDCCQMLKPKMKYETDTPIIPNHHRDILVYKVCADWRADARDSQSLHYKELYKYMLGENKKPEEVDVERIFLFEDLSKYIPAQKYRNGAMKGCIVKATYPVYNAQNITEPMKSLKIAHLVDRVEDFVASNQNEFKGVPLYIKIVRDVVDSYFSQYEFDLYNKWSMTYDYIDYNDNWLNPEEIPYLGELHSDWNHSQVPVYYMMNTFYKKASKYDAIGLYGYANYLTKRNLWMNMGQLYARTTVDDDESANTRNLITSFLIYNPNNFPVTVNYMTFA